MGKIPYSIKMLGSVNKYKIRQDILQSTKSDTEFRAEIRRVFQVANRRIQNIENAGDVLSPAVSSLNRGDIDRYTKFSMKHDWESLKIEYGRAISFLRQPTSTLTGARQYNEHLRATYDLTKDEFSYMARSLNNKLTSISDQNFVDKYLMRYKDFTGEMEASAKDISTQIESEAESLSRAIDNEIEEQANRIAEEAQAVQNQIASLLKTFGDFGL